MTGPDNTTLFLGLNISKRLANYAQQEPPGGPAVFVSVG